MEEAGSGEMGVLQLSWELQDVPDEQPVRTRRERVADILDRPASSRWAAAAQCLILVVIVASTATVIMQTVPELSDEPLFVWLEFVITALFTVELVLRFLVCESAEKFLTNGFNLADLLAVFPGYLELARHWSSPSFVENLLKLRTVRLLWLMRILRLVKVVRHSSLLTICVAVLAQTWRSGIAVVAALFLLLSVVSGSLLYLVESDHCEDLGTNCNGFDSIPASCWFSLLTLTTVGYGDTIPSTAAGKAIAGLTALCTVIGLALAVGLLAHSFAEQFSEERARQRLVAIAGAGRAGRESQELEELQDGLLKFKQATDELVTQLIHEATAKSHEERLMHARRRHPQVSPCMMPMLRSIERRASMLCNEMNCFVIESLLEKVPTATTPRDA